MNILSAIMFIMPQAKYHFEGEPTYENLVWDDLFYPKPTIEELEVAFKYAALSATNDYRIKRQEYYPTADQQLAMIYDLGIEGWKARIKNVKDSIPKPEIEE